MQTPSRGHRLGAQGAALAALMCLLLGVLPSLVGCQCDVEPTSAVSLTLIFPLDERPNDNDQDANDGDYAACFPIRANAAPGIDQIPGILEGIPATAGANTSCFQIEVVNEAAVGSVAVGDTVGTCRLSRARDGNTGSVLDDNDRFVEIDPDLNGDGTPDLTDVSVRVRVYDSMGNLLHAGHSVPFSLIPFDDPSESDIPVRVVMSTQNLPFCHSFHCEGDCTETDPAAGPFTAGNITTLHEPRAFHAALSLGDGRVLITGGQRVVGRFETDGTWLGSEVPIMVGSMEVYNARTGLFELLPNPMIVPRAGHHMVRLDNDEVLIYGGTSKGFGAGRGSTESFPFRLMVWDGADATTPPAEIINLATGMSRIATGAGFVMRALHAAGVVGSPPRAVVAGGVASRVDPNCGSVPPVPGAVYPLAFCSNAGTIDATNEIGIGVTSDRAAAASGVVGTGASSLLSIVGGNITDDPLSSLHEFRDESGALVGAGGSIQALVDALNSAIPVVSGPIDFGSTHSLVNATLTPIMGAPTPAALLFGGDVFDRTAGLASPVGELDVAGTCVSTLTCTSATTPGDCVTNISVAAGTTRTRPIAVAVDYDLNGPSISGAQDLSSFIMPVTEPFDAMSYLPGAVHHAATALPEGKVLITGGVSRFALDPSRTMLLYDHLNTPRFSIPDEWNCERHFIGTEECTFQDEIDNGFDVIRCMFDLRLGHTATLVSNDPNDAYYGLVVIAGGVSSNLVAKNVPYYATATAEFFDLRASNEGPSGGLRPCDVPIANPGEDLDANGLSDNVCRIATIPSPVE